MLLTRGLVFNIPNTLKLFNNTQIVSNTSLLVHAKRGYNAQLLNNCIKNIRYASTTTNLTDKNKVELERIYYGILTTQIKAVKIISFTTSLAGIAAQPILLQQVTKMGGGVPVIIGLCSFIGFFTFITPILLHYVVKRYVTHIEYNPVTKQYTANVLTFFCRNRKIEFSVDDVKVPDVPGMFTTFLIKDRAVFVDPGLFTIPEHFGKLMGYDKPIDFKLFQAETPKPKK